jgi:predicted site-specific integrase-resolvase
MLQIAITIAVCWIKAGKLYDIFKKSKRENLPI